MSMLRLSDASGYSILHCSHSQLPSVVPEYDPPEPRYHAAGRRLDVRLRLTVKRCLRLLQDQVTHLGAVCRRRRWGGWLGESWSRSAGNGPDRKVVSIALSSMPDWSWNAPGYLTTRCTMRSSDLRRRISSLRIAAGGAMMRSACTAG